MISKEKMKSMMVNSDWMIHQSVMSYIERATINAHFILPTLLEANETNGYLDLLSLDLISCEHLNIDEAFATQILDIITYNEDNDCEALFLCMYAPINFVNAQLLPHPEITLTQECIDVFKNRTTYTSAPPQQVWDALNGHGRVKTQGKINLQIGEILVNILATQHFPDENIIIDMLKDKKILNQWLGRYLCQLAGKRKLESAIPILCDLVCLSKDEQLSLHSARCLGLYHLEHILEIVSIDFYDYNLINQRSICDLYTRMPGKKSESLIIDLLWQRKRLPKEIIEPLFFALCDNFSPQAFVWGPKLVNDESVIERGEIKQRLLDMAADLEQDFPEKNKWESQINDEFIAKISRPNLGYQGTLADNLIKPKKIGNNAPCPCGSGKKYKKCCR